MHPDRGIVCMDRWSDGISTIPDDLNTLTCQSSGTKDAPGTLFHSPVTWNPAQAQPGPMLHINLRLLSQHLRQCHNCRNHSTSVSISISYTTLSPSLASEVLRCPPFPT